MRKCSAPDCGRAVVARGWCSRHYANWKRTGDPIPRLREWTRNPPQCTVEDCEEKCRAKGLCSVHYQRWRAYGDPLGGGPRQGPRPPCSVEGCGGIHQAHGLCRTHYSRWRKHGDPLHIAKPKLMETPRYEGMHGRLQKLRSGRCSDVEDYIELCPRCHARYDNHHPDMMPLKWWKVAGTYASALVAAASPDEALAFARAEPGWGRRFSDTEYDELLDDHEDDWSPVQCVRLPGPPIAAGVYHVYGE